MKTATKILIYLTVLAIIDMVIPIPFTTLMLIYVVMERPAWFLNIVTDIYNSWHGSQICVKAYWQGVGFWYLMQWSGKKWIKNRGGFMDPEKIILDLSNELTVSLKKMSEVKDVNEKEAYSRIVKNLSDSLGVFFNLAADMMPYDYDDDFDDIDNEDLPF